MTGGSERHKKWRTKNREVYNQRRKLERERSVPVEVDDYSTSRRRWTEYEISLLGEFKGTDAELAREIRRSVMAIQVKRALVARENEHHELTKAKDLEPRFNKRKRKRTLSYVTRRRRKLT